MGKGHSRYIPAGKPQRLPTIDDYLNDFFERFDAANSAEEHFFRQYFGYLQDEREKRIDEIFDALNAHGNQEIKGFVRRAVDARYAANPLCTIGSVGASGGRFNIGEGLPKYKSFHSLYLADSSETSYAEKHHHLPTFIRGKLNPMELGLRTGEGSYSSMEVEIELSNCLDLSSYKVLSDFCKVISSIKPTEDLQNLGRKIGFMKLTTVQNPSELRKTLLDPEYLKSAMLLDMPSNSQFLGHYCQRAGIEAVIYPSVRNTNGKNIAVFIDNLASSSFIRLTTQAPYIPPHCREITSKNFQFFKINTDHMMID